MGASASYAGALESGEMDVVIGNWPNPPDTLRTTALFQDRMVLLMRHYASPGGRRARCKTLSRSIPPCSNALFGGPARGGGHVPGARALRRNVVAHVPYFNMAPLPAPADRYGFTAPARFAEHYASFLPLAVRPVPLDLPPIAYLLWHDRTHHSAECRWFREQIVCRCCRPWPTH